MFLKPTLIAEDVTQINLSRLDELGIRGFIFDLDNTLMAPHTGRLEPHIEAWLASIQNRGFRSIVVSNNKSEDYVKQAEAVLKIPCYARAGKPSVSILMQAVEQMDLTPIQVAVVGDRPLTDILGGHWLGAHTILVESLSKSRESQIIRTLRGLEWLVIRRTATV